MNSNEWWRVHAFLDPACVGFAALVRPYNTEPAVQKNATRMINDPDEAYGLPCFHGDLPPLDGEDNGDRGTRLTPHPLTPQELKAAPRGYA
ncbi:MAG: hypothetical protein FJZ47_14600 [Candidatus Tectomicrobia bacterium]|uniref:Uncharacterized protein n=1 Tax=Tectimicrobiota bacterium TaxID=2528274 RepID=A0A937W1Q5_UNCTE|nr:hypothetical protein [Candidatus Tectomicrobia bacterium]